ncbi:MAG: thioredoxin family protein [Gammaproteobacteria bacterium]|nr:thioredoxin family protein [Gammaproteobacteria bacterium]
MTLTYSAQMAKGTVAPDFNLLDTVSGQHKTLQVLKSDMATVILFICNHCPYVVRIREKLAEITKHYTAKGIRFIAINANDVETYPADAPDKMKAMAEEFNFCFPYVYVETQEIAKAYDAACTPDLYIFDKDLKCQYHGRFDDSTPGNNVPVTGKDLTCALDQMLAGEAVFEDQKPSMGCNIKWKS